MESIFKKETVDALVARIQKLQADTQPQWGKMDVARMLAHCSVAYEMVYTDKHSRPNALVRFLLKRFVKNGVVNDRPYPKNSRTAPVFLIADEKEFEAEKNRLLAYLRKTQELGSKHFEGRESHSFGPLTAGEWSNLFHKHLDHHLGQFGV